MGLVRASQDKLIDPSTVTHLFKITKNLGMLVTGMMADAKSLVTKARSTAADFQFTYGYECPADYLAKQMADQAQVGAATPLHRRVHVAEPVWRVLHAR